jgi:peptidoglycan/xylan/chitin deacetylase (PgdA/CDA1 family)
LRFFRPLSLVDFLRNFKENKAIGKNSFMLTFDDGLRECHDIIAPILASYGVSATFFLCSAFVDNNELAYDHKKSLLINLINTKGRGVSPLLEKEIRATLEDVDIVAPSSVAGLQLVDYRRSYVLEQIARILDCDFSEYLKEDQPYLTTGQIIELLRMGHAIGAHSIDHPRYADLTLADQLYQTTASVKFVKERFALDYTVFSFPHSDAGISKAFFRTIFSTGQVDVCFGNQGLLKDDVARNVQRVAMEEPGVAAEAILGRAYARRSIKRLTGQLALTRR